MKTAGAQALLLVLLAVAWGFGANARRNEPVPLSGPMGPPPLPEAGAGLVAIPAEAALAAWESGTFFVDVRDSADYSAGHVSGAVLLPAGEFDARYFDLVATLGADVPLLVYGAGPDSFAVRHVAQELLDRGHRSVDLAVCGVDALHAAGLGSSFAEEELP